MAIDSVISVTTSFMVGPFVLLSLVRLSSLPILPLPFRPRSLTPGTRRPRNVRPVTADGPALRCAWAAYLGGGTTGSPVPTRTLRPGHSASL
jgi:hypothetical protein